MSKEDSIIRLEMGVAEWSLLLGLSVLWGLTYFFNGIAVTAYSPLFVVLVRVGLAALVLLCALLLLGKSLPISIAAWRLLFIMALLNNLVPFSLVVSSQTYIASGVASILNASTPLFAMVVAHFYTADEKLTINRTVGLLVGFAGVGTMLGLSMSQEGGVSFFAKIAVVCGAISFAIAGVFGRKIQELKIDPLTAATGQLMASTIIIFPIAALFARPWVEGELSIENVSALVGLAVLSTAVAYIMYLNLLASSGAVNLLIVTILCPATSVILGYSLLEEVILLRHISGMSLIAIGLAILDGRPIRFLRDIVVRSLI